MSRYLIFPLIIISLFSIATYGSEDSVNLFYIQPRYGFQAPKIFTQGQASSYTGQSYGGSLFYKIGDSDFSWAPSFTYEIGSYGNTANSLTQTEDIKESVMTASIKFYFGKFFIAPSYAWISFEDNARGTTNLSISDSSTGIGGSVGYAINISRYFGLEISANVSNANFQAKDGGFSNDSQYLKYGGMVGLNILLPSSPPRKSYFNSGAASSKSD